MDILVFTDVQIFQFKAVTKSSTFRRCRYIQKGIQYLRSQMQIFSGFPAENNLNFGGYSSHHSFRHVWLLTNEEVM